ncbi:hypothetical protein [Salsipaludibacter albus]|uniref:hypothetical protein n=1 Tax=Salsipaludibacter albus TaxID=2849650 RepID=UPI001EE40286|nr:hypothetical protein [Salsipaludibacter albus]MBY5162316.1 hypothetical protein [Salsipaludibacter albus]
MTPGDGPLDDRATRRRLLAALVGVHPWLADPDWGPAAVDPGTCDRCGQHPRLVTTCGPASWRALCRDCLLDVGEDAFCAGHADDAAAAADHARDLPDQWATLVRLAWVAAGQVRADRAWLDLAVADLTDPGLAALVTGNDPADGQVDTG